MKPWGGRFKDGTDPLLERFSASIDFDRKLYHHDIEGSKAHAGMLEKIGILTKAETKAIIKGLDEIEKEIGSGTFPFSDALEDIHMHIETRLIEKTEAGKKLHTGRSRNDQVSLDMRLFVRDEVKVLDERLCALLSAILGKAETEITVMMPGYTHLQRAQVVPFSHYLLGHYHALKRDRARLEAARKTADVLPLGSGALAGSTIPLDREWVRKKLGFARVSENSMDTVADRDFIMDAVFRGRHDNDAFEPARRRPDIICYAGIFIYIASRQAYHRIEPDAPQEKSGCPRAYSGQDRQGPRGYLRAVRYFEGVAFHV